MGVSLIDVVVLDVVVLAAWCRAAACGVRAVPAPTPLGPLPPARHAVAIMEKWLPRTRAKPTISP